MLAVVLCTGAVVLRLDARRKRVDRQLAVAIPVPVGSAGDQQLLRHIRLRSAQQSWGDSLVNVVLRYDRDAPFTWPVWRVAAAAIMAAAGVMVLAQMALPLW